MKYFHTLLLSIVFLSACAQNKAKDITEVSQKELNKGLVVDVRTPDEYNAGHLENAVNINWYDASFAKQFEDIDKGKTIFLYCKKGGRSAKAQEKLNSLGFTNVVNLEGGYDAYSKVSPDNK